MKGSWEWGKVYEIFKKVGGTVTREQNKVLQKREKREQNKVVQCSEGKGSKRKPHFLLLSL